RLVDFYNNIPFDQAAQGNTHLNPAYESGEVVYQKAVDLISGGMADLKASTTTEIENTGDLLFAGKTSMWLKFANTVKLRALIRQSEKSNQAYIASQIQAIVQEGSGFLEIGEDAMINPGYLNSAGKM